MEKDPNAPKKPANPFLQFCKEQRMMTNELLRGASDINKQELNKVLCNRWKTLAQEEKKVILFSCFYALVTIIGIFRFTTTNTNWKSSSIPWKWKCMIGKRVVAWWAHCQQSYSTCHSPQQRMNNLIISQILWYLWMPQLFVNELIYKLNFKSEHFVK